MKKSLKNTEFKKPKVLCLGDIMLDTFTYGSVDRISPEAPVPVLRQLRERSMLGGVGNVVSNLVKFECDITLISVIGNDLKGREVLDLLSINETVVNFIQVEKNRLTTHKNRFVCGKAHMLRVDSETTLDILQSTEDRIISLIQSLETDYDVVIISDYCKGAITEKIKNIVLSKFSNATTIIDTKNPDLEKYFGADIIVPNLKELESFSKKPLKDDSEIKAAVTDLGFKYNIAKFLVTQGSAGMSAFELVRNKNNYFDFKRMHLESLNKNPLDVSGAGDTVVATLALSLGSGLDYKQSSIIANIAAGIVVGKSGTSTVDLQELKEEIEKY